MSIHLGYLENFQKDMVSTHQIYYMLIWRLWAILHFLIPIRYLFYNDSLLVVRNFLKSSSEFKLRLGQN